MDYNELLFSFFFVLLSFFAFGLAWVMLFLRGYVLSAILSLIAIILVCLSAKSWLMTLVDSGKSTQALFPLAPLVYGVLVLGSLACLVLSLHLLKRRRARDEAPVEATAQEYIGLVDA